MNYTKSLYSKAFQNVPKIGIFGMKIYHLASLTRTRADAFDEAFEQRPGCAALLL
jgi:hypothetical protein